VFERVCDLNYMTSKLRGKSKHWNWKMAWERLDAIYTFCPDRES